MQAQRGWPAARLGEGVASQVGLARRESPHKTSRLLGLAKVLHREMPHTLHRMRTGELSEWRATIVARETACLTVDDRREVDQRLCGPEGTGPELSDHALANAAAKLAADLDNAAVAARATGDPRSRGQVMADTLVERVTGTSTADPVRVNLDLVMTDRTFFHTNPESSQGSAHVPGYGPVPAQWAHDLLAELIRRRDHDLCRTPWCGAPLRAIDHITEWQSTHETSETNTQGLCERCDLAKQAPGWTATPTEAARDGTERHTVITTTPTGHTHRSRAPAPLGHVDYNGRTILYYELTA